MISRQSRVKVWLEDISKDIDNMYKVFDLNLISVGDIGVVHHQSIVWQLRNLNMAIEEALFDLENK